jgi:Bacteriophage CII protein
MAEPCAVNSPLARKNASAILQRLAKVSQIAVSEAMNVSEATVSRLKSEHLESFSTFLAALALKVVPASAECYEPDYIEHLRYFARAGIAKDGEPKQPLTFESDE